MRTDTPRTRPAKPPLSRAAIVATTLALVDELGFAAVSMRRVAQALDTGPASLYVYIADRTELMAAAYDLALADVEIPTTGPWRPRLELLVTRAIESLGRHDDLASVTFADVPTGPHALRLTEAILTLLRTAALDDAACAWAADLLDAHITSSALELAARHRDQRTAATPPPTTAPDHHAPSPTGPADPRAASPTALAEATGARLRAVYDALPPDTFPSIHALRAHLVGGDRAAWKLRVLIDGLLAQSRPHD
ncbi:TetR/AcrR family transcriptional regulator [Catenuloplanes japonicus]|uniref:TetR/AcrR family transcriptional regulator n=1 Tax=Catenuloplanes japonicus TaxID=33876 RepID=UPI00052746EB|nr:TetR/AcrR family transcriptional regulator C-terminal domain-containing protein [Catenuloplanes japonicus]